ncbi:MAG: CDP-diacylglycerol--serine O-phosphatidyltransferase [Balneolaceae bacterium]|nr:CDP-diacylglycerol--serine O-phosphatidyltransferase [Balneolaceae bacterium]MCH8547376.1 CDP-diacylglycerol--serine O-phosphatidyltransferase [Balneolaceae bacterium]
MKYPIQKKRFRKRLKKRPKLKPIPRIVVPSFFTLMNLFCGFLSILMVAEGNLMLGAWLIVLAGLFDTLDGFMARLANATSDFGVELDSISDVVSFGVAPGFLLYTVAFSELAIIGVLLAALPPLCGAIRLARYNIESKLGDTPYFNGLPITGQALMISAIYLTFTNRMEWFDGFEHGILSVLVPVVILLSFLMVSTIPFDKIPKFDRQSIKEHKNRFIMLAVYLIIIVVMQDIGLMIVFSLFILKGVVMGIYIFWTQAFTDEPDPIERSG